MSDRLDIEGIRVSPHHYIGGKRVPSACTFTDLSPIDETVLGEIAAAEFVQKSADLSICFVDRIEIAAQVPAHVAIGFVAFEEVDFRLAG